MLSENNILVGISIYFKPFWNPFVSRMVCSQPNRQMSNRHPNVAMSFGYKVLPSQVLYRVARSVQIQNPKFWKLSPSFAHAFLVRPSKATTRQRLRGLTHERDNRFAFFRWRRGPFTTRTPIPNPPEKHSKIFPRVKYFGRNKTNAF